MAKATSVAIRLFLLMRYNVCTLVIEAYLERIRTLPIGIPDISQLEAPNKHSLSSLSIALIIPEAVEFVGSCLNVYNSVFLFLLSDLRSFSSIWH